MIDVPLALADSERTLWYVSLALGLVVALVVAAMLLLLLSYLQRILISVGGLLENATAVAENTANIPQLEATAPVLEQIAAEGVVQDGYMNALSQGYATEEEEAPSAPPS
ncbi:MAG: hypothetical protein ACXWZM_02795 [Solirubrobacterales bacterium]